ncbi:hypothetical protein J1605_010280 [Eschrichtius robustus]|uniref:Uncharacterized protein n=1 Tax=Eschrichtius robustus TaxID=9764 RepID=A0AB34GU29_ESCRO|nr:hypothetical protein J1605_010280 [Eschrichtius robustus]
MGVLAKGPDNMEHVSKQANDKGSGQQISHGAPSRTCVHPGQPDEQRQAEQLGAVPRPAPRPTELSGARSRADEEVAAASPSANWLPGCQLRRCRSAGGAHGGARGGRTSGSRTGAPQARAGAGLAARAPDGKGLDWAGARARARNHARRSPAPSNAGRSRASRPLRVGQNPKLATFTLRRLSPGRGTGEGAVGLSVNELRGLRRVSDRRAWQSPVPLCLGALELAPGEYLPDTPPRRLPGVWRCFQSVPALESEPHCVLQALLGLLPP